MYTSHVWIQYTATLHAHTPDALPPLLLREMFSAQPFHFINYLCDGAGPHRARRCTNTDLKLLSYLSAQQQDWY